MHTHRQRDRLTQETDRQTDRWRVGYIRVNTDSKGHTHKPPHTNPKRQAHTRAEGQTDRDTDRQTDGELITSRVIDR